MIRRVELRGVVKIRGATAVLKGAQATFRSGTIATIEGANGTGKSTLLSLVAGLSRPSRGSISLEMEEAGTRPRIGFVDHETLLYPDLTVEENLAFFSALGGVGYRGDGGPQGTKEEFQASKGMLRELLHHLGLEKLAGLPIRRCSRGQKQRAALARALIHKPDLLLLDEPDTGLDQKSREELLSILEKERARGCLLIMVTHDASFAAKAATDRFILERGKLREFPCAYS